MSFAAFNVVSACVTCEEAIASVSSQGSAFSSCRSFKDASMVFCTELSIVTGGQQLYHANRTATHGKADDVYTLGFGSSLRKPMSAGSGGLERAIAWMFSGVNSSMPRVAFRDETITLRS